MNYELLEGCSFMFSWAWACVRTKKLLNIKVRFFFKLGSIFFRVKIVFFRASSFGKHSKGCLFQFVFLFFLGDVANEVETEQIVVDSTISNLDKVPSISDVGNFS